MGDRRRASVPDLIVTRLDALVWLARLTQDGPLAPCVVCQRAPCSIWGFDRDGVKAGVHLTCVETGMARGVLVTPEPALRRATEEELAWIWRQLAPGYER